MRSAVLFSFVTAVTADVAEGISLLQLNAKVSSSGPPPPVLQLLNEAPIQAHNEVRVLHLLKEEAVCPTDKCNLLEKWSVPTSEAEGRAVPFVHCLTKTCQDQDGSTLFGAGTKCSQLGPAEKICDAPINYSLKLWEACPKFCGRCDCVQPPATTTTTTTADLGSGNTGLEPCATTKCNLLEKWSVPTSEAEGRVLKFVSCLKQTCNDQDGSTLFGGAKCASLGDPAKTCGAPINYSLKLWDACPKMCGKCACDPLKTTTTVQLGEGNKPTTTTTTVPTPKLCQFKRLDFSKVAHQNLGNWKKDGSAPVLKFSDVLKEGDVNLDLIISNSSEYHSKQPERNGIAGVTGMVRVNVQGSTFVDLKLQFVKSGTNEPYVVPSFLLSIFDFDQSTGGRGRESVSIAGFSKLYLAENRDLLVQDHGKGAFTFKSMREDIPGGKNNPKDILHLTKEQKQIAVGLRYDGRSLVTMRLAVEKGKFGRNIFFAGASSMQCSPKDIVKHPILTDF